MNNNYSHYGEKIQQLISDQKITLVHFRDAVNVSATAFSARLEKAHYASIHDFISAIVELQSTELIQMLLDDINRAGFDHGYVKESSYTELKEEYSIMKDNEIRYKKVIDKLTE